MKRLYIEENGNGLQLLDLNKSTKEIIDLFTLNDLPIYKITCIVFDRGKKHLKLYYTMNEHETNSLAHTFTIK